MCEFGGLIGCVSSDGVIDRGVLVECINKGVLMGDI